MTPSWKAPTPLPAPLSTERLVVRPYEKGDGPKIFAAVDAFRDRVLSWLPWAATEHRDVDDSIYFVEKRMRAMAEPGCLNFTFGVFESDGTSFIGGVGYHRLEPSQQSADVGYWVRGDRHGEGFCTEAVAAFVSSGLTPQTQGGWGFRRITLHCSARNRASSRVAEKLGFRLECRQRAERYMEPESIRGYHDSLGYAVLADEWDFERQRAVSGIGWADGPFK